MSRESEPDASASRDEPISEAASLALERAARERAEAALRVVLENAPVIHWAIDVAGRFTVSHGAGLSALGLESGEAIGQSVFDRYRDHPQVLDCLRRALGGESFRAIVSLGDLAFDSRYLPLRDERGVVVGVEGVATVVPEPARLVEELQRAELRLADADAGLRQRTADLERLNRALEEQIAERQRANDELQAARDDWQSILENVQDFILRIGADGQIDAINRIRPDRTREQVEGATVYEFLPPESVAHAQEVVRRVFETGEPADDEIKTVGPDGQPQWFSSRLGPIKRDGRVVAVTVVSRDITRQRLAEEEAHRRREELAHLSRAATLGEMVATLAHEVNTPLGAILHFAQGCILRLERLRDEERTRNVDAPVKGRRDGRSIDDSLAEVVDALRQIAEQTERSTETIRRIRGFLQQRSPEVRLVDVDAGVRGALTLLSAEIARRDVRVELDLVDGAPLVPGDDVQLQQVCLNLLLNGMEAMDRTPRGDRVLSVRTTADDGAVRIEVRDRGCGIDPDRLDWVFEPFHTTKAQGLGMGLAICRSIVTSYGGKLECVPHANAGVTMRVSLPCASANPERPRP